MNNEETSPFDKYLMPKEAPVSSERGESGIDFDSKADRGMVKQTHLRDNAISGDQIADGAITAAKIANNAVQTSKILNGAVTSAKLSGTFDVNVGTIESAVATTLTGSTIDYSVGTIDNLVVSTIDASVGTIDTFVSTSATATTVNAGSVVASGMLRQGSTWHAYGGFQDTLATITIGTANTWYHITNAGNNLWTGVEADGFSLSSDVMTVTNAGDYTGMVNISLSALQGKDYEIRCYNITQGTIMGYHLGVTTTGANNYMNISVPLYLECNANDQLRMEIQNITDTTNPVLKHAIFYLIYLHD